MLYGTAWKEERTGELVGAAIASGFRAFDTANQRKHYFEEGVGAALKEAFADGLRREELFLQTKFTYLNGQDHRLPYDPAASVAEQVRQSFASSLKHLGTNYLDSYLLHGPESGRGLTDNDWAVWCEMEILHERGHAKTIGVSNVNANQLDALLSGARVKPSYVQNRCYPSVKWDMAVRGICKDANIVYQGFNLIADPKVWRSDAVLSAADAINDVSVIILSDAPLRVGRRDALFDHARGRPAETKRVVGSVEPVIERPDQAAGLVLEISSTRTAGVPKVLFVRHTVTVGVGVKIQIVGVCFADYTLSFAEWQDQPRKRWR